MRFDRTKNSKRNIVWGLITKIISIILPFAMRTIIIYTLGNLYLGLGSLFTSILNALNLAELGVGSALVFSMYKPVVDDDREKIKALLNVYKKTYFIIGIVVLTIGFALLPFLNVFINGNYPSDINIRVVYVIQLLTTAAGYFFMAYKGSLLQAYQRADIVNKLHLVTQFCMYVIQIVGLVVFKNFYIYVIAQLFQIVLFDIVQSIIVGKKFPNLKAEGVLPQNDKKEIVVKTGALMGHKVAGMVINSVDNIFISMFMGLEIVAIYNNYFYVITALSGVFLMLTSGLNAIVGNYLVKETNDNILRLFNILHYLVSYAICICCTCLLVLLQPFMNVWVGNSILPYSSVVLFVIYFFTVKVRTVGILFKDSAGLWEKDVLKAWLQIVIDLVIDIWLLKTIGINGAIISTIVSMIFAYFYETYIIFKYCLQANANRYYGITAIYGLLTMVSCGISHYICSYFEMINRWVKLPVFLGIAVIVSGIVFLFGTIRTMEASEGLKFLKDKILKRG